MQLVKCLVTGASGFIGRGLLPALKRAGHVTTLASRTYPVKNTDPLTFSVGAISDDTDWTPAVANQDVVIHLANRAHSFNHKAVDALSEYRKVNVEGTLNLARQAAEAGAKRFIYLSSIKVNGERTSDHAFRCDDVPAPEDHYGISKWEAEQGLNKLCEELKMELVIIRPPLVYGPGVKGNLQKLTQAIDSGLPLPLGGITNRRDLISLYNLTDLIVTCVDHPRASGHTFLCSDGCPVSTSELITWIAKARGKKLRLFKLPATILVRLLSIVGKQGLCERLFGDLRIEMTDTQAVLGWEPPVAFEAGVLKAFALDSELNRTTDD